VFEWHGSETDCFERAKGLELAIRLGSLRGDCQVVPLEQGQETQEFWEAVGGKGEVKEASDPADEEERGEWPGITLMVVKAGADGKVETETVGGGGGGGSPLSRSVLETDKVYAVEARDIVLVWVGSGCSAEVRRDAAGLGAQIAAAGGKGTCRVVEGCETCTFRDCFVDWGKDGGGESDGAGEVEKLLQIDGGGGAAKVWRVFKSGQFTSLVPVAEASSSQFYSAECNVVEYRYTSEESGQEDVVIFFWIGSDSAPELRESAERKSYEMFCEVGERPMHVRLHEGAETHHFLSVFKSAFVVHKGSRSSLPNNKSADEIDRAGEDQVTALYRVMWTGAGGRRAVQVERCATSLRSTGVFALCLQVSAVSLPIVNRPGNETGLSRSLPDPSAEILTTLWPFSNACPALLAQTASLLLPDDEAVAVMIFVCAMLTLPNACRTRLSCGRAKPASKLNNRSAMSLWFLTLP
jgi:hypothetical protein